MNTVDADVLVLLDDQRTRLDQVIGALQALALEVQAQRGLMADGLRIAALPDVAPPVVQVAPSQIDPNAIAQALAPMLAHREEQDDTAVVNLLEKLVKISERPPAVSRVTGPGAVSINNEVVVRDDYQQVEVLADQGGSDAATSFTFSEPVHMAFVQVSGGSGRAAPSTPTATYGIPCDDGIATPVLAPGSGFEVYAPTGATISVWGYRRVAA